MNKDNKLGMGLGVLLSNSKIKNTTNEGSQKLNISQIQPNPSQPRKYFNEEDLNELATSIKNQGLIQPLVVREIENQQFQIIAGERRWRASQKAGLHDVPVIIKNLDDKEILEIALIENMQREDLNPIEEAEGIARLQDEFKYTQEELSNILGKSRPQISNRIRLLKLPQKVKEFVQNKTLSAGHARALVGLEDSYAIAQVAIKKNMNVRQLETYISYVKNKRGKKGNKTKDPNILSLENEITQMLGLIIKIDHKDSEKGKLEIFYNNLEQLDDLIKKLRK